MALESAFKKQLKKELVARFPGCKIIQGNSAFQQGVPDWLILYNDRWAFLEVKRSADAPHQPNQPWWVEELDAMSFAAFIYPENAEEVLSALSRSFQSRRHSRLPQR